MRFLISMVFVGMLALSSQAFAAKIQGASAEKILINGKVVAQRWIDSRNQHHTRVTYKGIYYACVSDINQQVKGKLYLGCWTTHQLFLKLPYALETKAGLVKWYNGSFVMISWEFDPLIQHHNQPIANACFLVSSFRLSHPLQSSPNLIKKRPQQPRSMVHGPWSLAVIQTVIQIQKGMLCPTIASIPHILG